MKFYDREQELAILQKNWEQSSRGSVMTTLIGRRRVGKTSLLLKSVEGKKHLYIYIPKDNEQMLCQRLQRQAEHNLGLHIYGQVTDFGQLFENLMVYGEENNYTLIIDEFQNLLSVNKAIPSMIQDIWDRHKENSHVNLILCGSIYSMMKRIFDNSDEPLYGRRDSAIRLLPFSPSTLKTILKDHNPRYIADDLLCLYMLTGGVAKYVSLLMDAGACDKEKMLDYAIAKDSPLLTEGTEMILSEFGRDYGTYLAIMELIANGKTSQTAIDSIIGKNTGAYLNNLSQEYALISKNIPLLSKPGNRNIRWQINDQFLRYWFRFIHPYQSLIEGQQLGLLRNYIGEHYEEFSGKVLENYFHVMYMASGQYTRIGNWWDRKGQYEIDMVAINEFDKYCVVAEIKRNRNKISMHNLEEKIKCLPHEFSEYSIQTQALSLEDM